MFNTYGWRAAAALSVGWQGLCLLVIFMRGPHCQRYTWLGYEGGYSIRKQSAHETDKEKEVEMREQVPKTEDNRASGEQVNEKASN